MDLVVHIFSWFFVAMTVILSMIIVLNSSPCTFCDWLRIAKQMSLSSVAHIVLLMVSRSSLFSAVVLFVCNDMH